MSKLIAVSNRTAAGNAARAGGLAVALRDMLQGGSGLWVGWSGKLFDFPTQKPREVEDADIQFRLLDLSKPEYDGYYLGYSNAALWPVVHNRLDLAHFEPESFSHYRRVNARFSDAVAEMAGPDDTIWVHDFHLFLMGAYLRDREVENRLGLFLHTPFPAADVFRAVPGHEEFAQSLASFDVVGVQTETDLRNLARYISEELNAESLGDHVYRTELPNGTRDVRLLHCPIGLDAQGFADLADTDEAQSAAATLSRFLGGRDLVIGVDRMDYSKGLPQRFEGMATLFDQNEHRHGNISFTQIAPPSRADVQEYQDLREELDRLAGRINGNYGDLDWLPIRYLARGYTREQLAGLYRLARVGLVTPLQDGMNLVAKEYIAAQDPNDPGVLVLSRFAGAAEQMEMDGEGALIINPHDQQDIADAVLRALDMPLSERRARWKRLWDNILEEDIIWWRKRFLDELNGVSR